MGGRLFVHLRVYSTTRFLFVGILFFLLSFTGINTCMAQRITAVEQYDTTLLNLHSPRKASLYSAIIPGLGQVYNRKYWKIPLIYGGGAALIYYINFTNKIYMQRKRLLVMVDGDDPKDRSYIRKELRIGENATYDKKYIEETLLSSMNSFRRYRDLNAIGLAALYLANIIDATVDAYLYDYDVSQDLSLKVKPTFIYTPFSQEFGLSCSLRF